MLTGRDFSEHDAQTKKEIKKARKEAVHDYVNQKIREANQRQKELAVQIQPAGKADDCRAGVIPCRYPQGSAGEGP